MLKNLLDAGRWNLEVIGFRNPSRPSSSIKWPKKQPALVCLAATPPGGLAHVRYLCSCLRARFPDLKILVCRWDYEAGTQSNPGQLLEAGADSIAATLLETRQQLASLLPVLSHNQKEQDHSVRRGGRGQNRFEQNEANKAAARMIGTVVAKRASFS